MTSPRPGPLTADQIAAFDRDGFVIVRDFFPAADVDKARAGLTALMEQQREAVEQETPGVAPAAEDAPFETRFLEVFGGLAKSDPARVPLAFRPELHREELYPILFSEKLLDAVQQLIPVPEIRLFPNYTARPKLPDFEPHRVVWHQDAGLDHRGAPNSAAAEERITAFGRDAMVNVWTGFVPVGVKEGCMLMIPGTQKLGCVEHVLESQARTPGKSEAIDAPKDTMVADADVNDYAKGYQSAKRETYTTAIRPDIVEAAASKTAPVHIETRPGDVVLFQNLTFHRSGTNTSKVVRWSLDWRYQDATKPTHRPPEGFLARSAASPDLVPPSPAAWAADSFR